MTDHLDPSDSGSNPSPDQWDAIGRFLSGEASPGDAAEIRQWLSAHPADAHLVASLDGLLPPSASDAKLTQGLQAGRPQDGMLPFGRPIDVEAALRRVHTDMETAVTSPTLTVVGGTRKARVSGRSAVPPKRSWSGLGWAAAAALVAAVGYTQFQGGTPSVTSVAQTFTTPVGATDTVTLTDSSRIVLAPGSRLTVAANYGNGTRDVQLEGTAQFTVAHDKKRPFSVRAGAALIKDLGTVFTVKTDSRAVVVAVTEGSVALSDSSGAGSAKPVNLSKGDRGRLNMDGTLVAERGSVTPDDSAWVVGKLVYTDASWADVRADLKRWHGVELVVRDSTIGNRSITMTDGVMRERPEKLVARLAAALDGVVTRSNDTLYVDRSGDRPKH